MADLSAVLKKTIDALPAATPQLRAKVYEKARAAVERQIANANPPLAPEMADARHRALEDAIVATEAYYQDAGTGEGAFPSAPAETTAAQPHEPIPVVPPSLPPQVRREIDPVERPARNEEPRTYDPPPRAFEPARDHEPAVAADRPAGFYGTPERGEPEDRVGEVGPMSASPEAGAGDFTAEGSNEPRRAVIPEADMTAPNYARPRRASGSRRSLLSGVAALLFIAGLGAVGYFYLDEITETVGGAPPQVAGAPEATPETPVAETGEAASGEAGEPAAPAAPDPSARQFTQRLLPDGTEVDEGPAPSAPNAFDEGTDIAAASALPGEAASPPAAIEAPAAAAAVEEVALPPGGQRAVFYEERSEDRAGSQQGGSVVWSVVSEPPASGQPAEPAIRAVANVADTNIQMTMTIRRNADETLPASHVIELLFDTPADFPGGEIENVQRLALKPTEEDRGEPLIGVAGRISDGFFIIALNDLQQAVDNNLALMADQEWIDIPMAYATGQRALMSLEKGASGDEVFEEALAAWAARG